MEVKNAGNMESTQGGEICEQSHWWKSRKQQS